jgi:hypothetical protein
MATTAIFAPPDSFESAHTRRSARVVSFSLMGCAWALDLSPHSQQRSISRTYQTSHGMP